MMRAFEVVIGIGSLITYYEIINHAVKNIVVLQALVDQNYIGRRVGHVPPKDLLLIRILRI